jgi:hypothetical protein
MVDQVDSVDLEEDNMDLGDLADRLEGDLAVHPEDRADLVVPVEGRVQAGLAVRKDRADSAVRKDKADSAVRKDRADSAVRKDRADSAVRKDRAVRPEDKVDSAVRKDRAVRPEDKVDSAVRKDRAVRPEDRVDMVVPAEDRVPADLVAEGKVPAEGRVQADLVVQEEGKDPADLGGTARAINGAANNNWNLDFDPHTQRDPAALNRTAHILWAPDAPPSCTQYADC